MGLGKRRPFPFLDPRRDAKFATFDAVFAGADIRIVRTVRHRRRMRSQDPFVGALRRECLDHLLNSDPNPRVSSG